MRLTLRTLLAYLDDTLDSSQVKTIGQKVAESDTAQELIARIKQVTRRRRLTVPPDSAKDGGLDANTIAEYLDNKLSEDTVAEVEQTCLGSDVQLAEMAASHQILTLILGEPMLIPPSSYQRMYDLIKGRASIPNRYPPGQDVQPQEGKRRDEHETDETLRMGLPAFRKSSLSSRLILIAGGLAACAILVVAIFFALKGPGPFVGDGNVKVAGNGSKDKTNEAEPKGKSGVPPDGDTKKKKTKANGKTNEKDKKKKNGSLPKTKKKDEKAKSKKATKQQSAFPDVPTETPPSEESRPVGRYQVTGKGLLFKNDPTQKSWQRVDARQPVATNWPLVSLPGFQSTIDTNRGVQLVLWGLQPEQVFFPTLMLESSATLHANDLLDMDATLHRGRITIANHKNKPAFVRLRMANPTKPDYRVVWDLTLLEKGTEVFVERLTFFPPNEPYYSDEPKHPNRKGPAANAHLLVLNGKVKLKENKYEQELKQPPGKGYVAWGSLVGTGKAKELEAVPDWATAEGKLPAKMKAEDRTKRFQMKVKMLKITEELAAETATIPYQTVLRKYLKSPVDYERGLAIRCYMALADLPALIDAMNIDDPKRSEVRRAAIAALKRWLTYERNNAYVLRDALRVQKYTKTEADYVMTLLHSFSLQDVADPNTYRFLIRELNSPKIVMRELAGWHLYYELQVFLEKGTTDHIKYDPSMLPEMRQTAQEQWQALLDTGKIPPRAMKPGK